MSRLLSRIASFIFLVLAIFILSRAMIRALPGDPLETIAAESGTSITINELRAEFHLDRPFLESVLLDMRNAIQGDLGISLISRQPIAPLIRRRLTKTAELTLLATAMTLVLSVFLGLAAANPNTSLGRIMDPVCSLFGALTGAMPIAWVGPLLMVIFCIWIPLFPIGDEVLLPAITLALSFSGVWSRLIRERVRESLATGAAPGARARGIPEWKVLLKYGLAPVSGALVAYFGTQLGSLMAGSFITEIIFDWQGMGTLFVDSVLRRDYPVVESATFVAATLALAGTALGDWAQNTMDPRL